MKAKDLYDDLLMRAADMGSQPNTGHLMFPLQERALDVACVCARWGDLDIQLDTIDALKVESAEHYLLGRNPWHAGLEEIRWHLQCMAWERESAIEAPSDLTSGHEVT
jgi:hypothetical protein